MIADFKKRNIPIDGLGLQSHLSTINSTNERIVKMIQESAATGLKVHISELDVSVNSKNDSLFVYNDDAKAKQRAMYETVFTTFSSIPKEQQYGITVWDISDKDTWLRTTFKRPKEYPCLFDEDYQRKSIYDQLVALLQNK